MSRHTHHRRLRPIAPLAGLALLTGCTVGPNYYGPPPGFAPVATAPGAGFRRQPLAPVTPDPPPSRWWMALRDPVLDRLIDAALLNSPTLKQAQANIRKARAVLSEDRTKLLPTGGATTSAVHIELPSKTSSLVGAGGPASGALGGIAAGTAAAGSASQLKLPGNLDLYSAGFDASWEIDIFGGVRRGIESARASVGAQIASFHDSQVQLASEVAQNFVNLRDAQRRVALGRQAIANDEDMLLLTQQRRALGTAADSDVESQRSQLAQDRSALVSVQIQVDQAMDQLALLTGREAGTIDAELAVPAIGAAVLTPPATVAIGDPAAMLRRRPDVRQAERQLAADNATIGQNVADYFPSVKLFGALTWGSTSLSNLFSSQNMTGLLVPSISWNFFTIPQTRAKVRQAKAQRDVSLANYQQKVLSALQDAEDQLTAFGRQRESVAQLTIAAASATRSAAIDRQRYAGGTASRIDWLNSERQRAQSEQSLSQAMASLTNDFVALQKSLGLGWENAPDPVPLPMIPRASADADTGQVDPASLGYK